MSITRDWGEQVGSEGATCVNENGTCSHDGRGGQA